MARGIRMIRLTHLSKRFGELIAVDDLSLDIQEGEILGFLGPNGAGKTTTIRMLCGLLEKDAGDILWDTQAPLSETLGFCPQENLFWPRLTCLEQLIFTGRMHKLSQDASRKSALSLLGTLGLIDKQNTFASKLSGGMKRRLNIALALVHDPPVLILDEPEAGLDPQSRILVRDLIRYLAQEKTVILTTHNMDEAERLVDRVAIIDQGKLLELGSVDSLKETLGVDDVLEIKVNDHLLPDIEEKEHPVAQLQQTLRTTPSFKDANLSRVENKLTIRTSNALEKLSDLTRIARDMKLEISDIQLRKTTLEDVFIHLTGRALRE